MNAHSWSGNPPSRPGWYWIRHDIAGQPVYGIAQHVAHTWYVGSRKLDNLKPYSFWTEPLEPPVGGAAR